MSALVIVGGGLAGAKAAEGARDAGFDGRIVIVGDELHRPYERPPLSKAVLRGEADPSSAEVHDAGFYDERGVELLAGAAVTALDPAARRIHLDGGQSLDFDVAVLATGASPRRLTVPGSDLRGVHHLRTIDDAEALRDAIRHGGRVAVVGAGWIGSEVAASARQMGAEVVLIDPSPVPLHRVLGDELGAVFRDLHASHGVTLRLGVGVAELRGDCAVREVVLDDGRVEAADVVVAGIGVTPNVALAEAAGLAVGDGVLVDAHLQTSVPGIYAAGDVALAFHPHYERHLRVEHWSTALNQGGTAGRNAAGAGESYRRLPYFFSDQYDVGLEYVGHAGQDDEVVLRGNPADGALLAFWLDDGIVTAAMHVNTWDATDDLRSLVAAKVRPGRDRLADAAVALADLA